MNARRSITPQPAAVGRSSNCAQVHALLALGHTLCASGERLVQPPRLDPQSEPRHEAAASPDSLTAQRRCMQHEAPEPAAETMPPTARRRPAHPQRSPAHAQAHPLHTPPAEAQPADTPMPPTPWMTPQAEQRTSPVQNPVCPSQSRSYPPLQVSAPRSDKARRPQQTPGWPHPAIRVRIMSPSTTQTPRPTQKS